MRRNTINSTSGFKMDLKFGLLVPKNIYGVKFCLKTVILSPFCSILRFHNAHWDFWLEFRVFPPKLGVTIFFYNFNLQKALSCTKTRLMTHKRSKSVRGSDLCGRARTPKKNKKITKKGHSMTMLGIAGGGEQGNPSKLKICRGRAGPNVITGAKPHLGGFPRNGRYQ